MRRVNSARDRSIKRRGMELWRMRQELRELRAALRREWQAKLEQIKVEPLWVDQLPPDFAEWIARNPLIPQQYKETLRNGGKLPPDIVEWILRNPLNSDDV